MTLSGAPRLATGGSQGARHACCCRARGKHHECACPLCRSARLAAIEKLPPCHRAAALAALAEEDPAGDARAAAGAVGTGRAGLRPRPAQLGKAGGSTVSPSISLRPAKPSSSPCQCATAGSPNCQQR